MIIICKYCKSDDLDICPTDSLPLFCNKCDTFKEFEDVEIICNKNIEN